MLLDLKIGQTGGSKEWRLAMQAGMAMSWEEDLVNSNKIWFRILLYSDRTSCEIRFGRVENHVKIASKQW